VSEPLPEPQRSPERARLAQAIAHLGGLDKQLERLAEARSRLDRRGKEHTLDSAHRALDQTRQRAPEILIAKMMGELVDPALTVEHAQAAVEGAQRELDETTAADRLLADEIKVVEERREVAQHARDHAVAEVVKSSAEVVALCDAIALTRQQLHDYAWVLSAISLGRLPPGFFWDGIVHGHDSGGGKLWRAAISALETDPDTVLPG
jgi:hypothetical protein